MKVQAFHRATLVVLTLFCASAFAQETGSKIAIINIQDAITRTQEGQQLIQDLQKQYAPKSQEIEAKNQEINDLRAQLNKGANTMSDDGRRDLQRRIQQKERDAERLVEDARGEFNQAQQSIFNDVGGKLMTVIDKFAKEKGFAIVLDISSPQSPVLYAVNEVNITNDVIVAYDSANPAAAPSGE